MLRYGTMTLVGLLLLGCAAQQVSGALLSSYDAAVAAEILVLKTGKVSAAEAQRLENLRITAWADVQAVVAAEQSGGNTAGVLAAANLAVSALMDESNLAKGK